MLPRKETKYIVITATMTDERIPVREIEWRARKYGFLDAGCHFVIEPDLVTVCRPFQLTGVGARPHNATSVIVNLSGKAPFTEGQMVGLAEVVDMLVHHYPTAVVIGHGDLPGSGRNGTPGFDVFAWYAGHKAASGL